MEMVFAHYKPEEMPVTLEYANVEISVLQSKGSIPVSQFQGGDGGGQGDYAKLQLLRALLMCRTARRGLRPPFTFENWK